MKKEKLQELRDCLNSSEKECKVCKGVKLIAEFPKSPGGMYGVGAKCKSCVKAKMKALKLNPPTPEQIEQARAEREQAVKARRAENLIQKEGRRKIWQEKQAKRALLLKDPEYIREQKIKDRRSDLWWERKCKIEAMGQETYWENWRIGCKLRSKVSAAIRANNKRNIETELLIGCSVEFLKSHLQNKFKRGMSFENYGLWHIDHIIPCAAFDLTDIEQVKICFHFSNMQALWAKENIGKGARMKEPVQMHLPLHIIAS